MLMPVPAIRRSLRGAALVCAILALVVAAPAYGAYGHASGGVASPSTLTAGGDTDYSVSLTGRTAVVDVVLVLDNSGSMATDFGGGVSRWSNVATRAKAYVDSLNSSGLFTRGGKVGVVLFSDAATTAAAPTTNVATIKSAIDGGAPSSQSCISCGIQQATDLLTAIPGSASHRRIVYVLADGESNVTPPTVADAVAASDAAHIERRVIGIGSAAMGKGLESADSSGVVPYATTGIEIGQDLAAEPTAYGGATNFIWTFHVRPDFTPSSPTVSAGTVSVSGHDVTWSLPSLGAQTVTLSFHAKHHASAGCGAKSLLWGLGFADSEGDPTPPAGLGALTVGGCGPPPDPTKSPSGLAALRSALGRPVFELSSVKLGDGARAYGTATAKARKLRVPAKGGRIKVFGILCDGCTVTVDPSVLLPRKGHKTKTLRLKRAKLALDAGEPGVVRIKLTKAQAGRIRKARRPKLRLRIAVKQIGSGATKRTTTTLKLVRP
jgi:hypothetical protein